MESDIFVLNYGLTFIFILCKLCQMVTEIKIYHQDWSDNSRDDNNDNLTEESKIILEKPNKSRFCQSVLDKNPPVI